MQNTDKKQILTHLIHALRHNKSSAIRKNAALILGKIGDRKAVDVLIKALNDRVISVRSNAAIALGMIGDKRAVEPLIRSLQAASWRERLNAAISLGWLADPGASPELIALLCDEHAYVRRGAAFALGQIADPEIKKVLLELLTDEREPVPEAAMVLAYMGDLSGYHFLHAHPPHHFKDAGRSQKKLSPADVCFHTGNLFYASGLFNEAVSEYRRGLAAEGKTSMTRYCSTLNNLGNALCSVGQMENAVVLYMLAMRMKSRENRIMGNLERAEILLDIQDLVVERLKQWLAGEESGKIELPEEALRFFKTLLEGIEPAHHPLLLRHFTLGWRSFYALQAYEGEELFSPASRVPSLFLEEHAPRCRAALFSDPTFRQTYALVSRVGDDALSSLKGELAPELHAAARDGFTCGYLVGLLQKIWHLSHLKFSVN